MGAPLSCFIHALLVFAYHENVVVHGTQIDAKGPPDTLERSRGRGVLERDRESRHSGQRARDYSGSRVRVRVSIPLSLSITTILRGKYHMNHPTLPYN